MRIKLTIAYDGKGFAGFQRQKDKRTVQGELETAILKIFGAKATVFASGRTDAGVHALEQVAHFDAPKPIAAEKLAGAFNHYLPSDIRIKKAEKAAEGFDSRRSAKKKTYFYDMYVSKTVNPLLEGRALRLEHMPFIRLMNKAAKLFVGEHDFYAFYCTGSSAKTTVRIVYECEISVTEYLGEQVIRLTVSANGFLYKMVRLIVSTVIKAGLKKITLTEIRKLLNVKNLPCVKTPAPSCGLYLKSVEYGE